MTPQAGTDRSIYLLGIDSGLTVTKAVIFDANGREIASASVRVPSSSPHPRWVERDMMQAWEGCQQAIRGALERAGLSGDQITGIGVTAHGDGIYLVDEQGHPVRPGILSLDTRAYTVLEGWQQSGVLEKALRITGQYPYAPAPASLLAWMKAHEPESLDRARWFFACKDWIRYKLTGQIATDPTEASLSFTDVTTQQYTPDSFRLFGLEALDNKKPPVIGSTEVAGTVTEEAARLTALNPGTPVVCGLHDVDASAIGSGCVHPGQLSVVAGTFSINQVISATPVLNPRWVCRNFVQPGQWMNMSVSPASSTNLEWFVRELCQAEIAAAAQQNQSVFELLNKEVAAVLHEDISVYFLPFIYGSPHSDRANAVFFGLRGWHGRGHLLRAIFEGVVFNHKTHVEALRSGFPVTEVRITGGASRSEIWCQMFADALGLPVITTDAQETGALGTAICAGIGAGVYESLEDAARRTVRDVRVYTPVPEQQAKLADAYRLYIDIIQALLPVWSRMT